ncbi:MAG: hypothetical protein GF384_05825, partial [Elusimicrobia bacterium]|nr:hypothetical protein [Elusimicrobiota bacterium]
MEVFLDSLPDDFLVGQEQAFIDGQDPDSTISSLLSQYGYEYFYNEDGELVNETYEIPYGETVTNTWEGNRVVGYSQITVRPTESPNLVTTVTVSNEFNRDGSIRSQSIETVEQGEINSWEEFLAGEVPVILTNVVNGLTDEQKQMLYDELGVTEEDFEITAENADEVRAALRAIPGLSLDAITELDYIDTVESDIADTGVHQYNRSSSQQVSGIVYNSVGQVIFRNETLVPDTNVEEPRVIRGFRFFEYNLFNQETDNIFLATEHGTLTDEDIERLEQSVNDGIDYFDAQIADAGRQLAEGELTQEEYDALVAAYNQAIDELNDTLQRIESGEIHTGYVSQTYYEARTNQTYDLNGRRVYAQTEKISTRTGNLVTRQYTLTLVNPETGRNDTVISFTASEGTYTEHDVAQYEGLEYLKPEVGDVVYETNLQTQTGMTYNSLGQLTGMDTVSYSNATGHLRTESHTSYVYDDRGRVSAELTNGHKTGRSDGTIMREYERIIAELEADINSIANIADPAELAEYIAELENIRLMADELGTDIDSSFVSARTDIQYDNMDNEVFHNLSSFDQQNPYQNGTYSIINIYDQNLKQKEHFQIGERSPPTAHDADIHTAILQLSDKLQEHLPRTSPMRPGAIPNFIKMGVSMLIGLGGFGGAPMAIAINLIMNVIDMILGQFVQLPTDLPSAFDQANDMEEDHVLPAMENAADGTISSFVFSHQYNTVYSSFGKPIAYDELSLSATDGERQTRTHTIKAYDASGRDYLTVNQIHETGFDYDRTYNKARIVQTYDNLGQTFEEMNLTWGDSRSPSLATLDEGVILRDQYGRELMRDSHVTETAPGLLHTYDSLTITAPLRLYDEETGEYELIDPYYSQGQAAHSLQIITNDSAATEKITVKSNFRVYDGIGREIVVISYTGEYGQDSFGHMNPFNWLSFGITGSPGNQLHTFGVSVVVNERFDRNGLALERWQFTSNDPSALDRAFLSHKDN